MSVTQTPSSEMNNLDLPFYEEMLPLIVIVIATFAAMQLLDNFLLQPFIFSTSVIYFFLRIIEWNCVVGNFLFSLTARKMEAFFIPNKSLYRWHDARV